MVKARSKMLSRPVSSEEEGFEVEVIGRGKNLGSARWVVGMDVDVVAVVVGERLLKMLRFGEESVIDVAAAAPDLGALNGAGGCRAAYGRGVERVGVQSIVSSEGGNEGWA